MISEETWQGMCDRLKEALAASQDENKTLRADERVWLTERKEITEALKIEVMEDESAAPLVWVLRAIQILRQERDAAKAENVELREEMAKADKIQSEYTLLIDKASQSQAEVVRLRGVMEKLREQAEALHANVGAMLPQNIVGSVKAICKFMVTAATGKGGEG